MGTSVLIVDDSLFIRKILSGILTEKGYDVSEAASGIDATRHLYTAHPDIIMLDIVLPDSNGLELLESIISVSPASKVIVCSSIGESQVIQKARDLGACGFLLKPFTPETVAAALAELVE